MNRAVVEVVWAISVSGTVCTQGLWRVGLAVNRDVGEVVWPSGTVCTQVLRRAGGAEQVYSLSK